MNLARSFPRPRSADYWTITKTDSSNAKMGTMQGVVLNGAYELPTLATSNDESSLREKSQISNANNNKFYSTIILLTSTASKGNKFRRELADFCIIFSQFTISRIICRIR